MVFSSLSEEIIDCKNSCSLNDKLLSLCHLTLTACLVGYIQQRRALLRKKMKLKSCYLHGLIQFNIANQTHSKFNLCHLHG